MLAMLARIAGAAIVASATLVAITSRGRERRAAVVLGCVAFAAWCGYVALLTHDPTGSCWAPELGPVGGAPADARPAAPTRPRRIAALAAQLGRRGTLALGVGFALAQWFFVSWAFVYPHVLPP